MRLRIGVIGSRDFLNISILNNILSTIKEKYNIEELMIVSGGAKGADTLAQHYAKQNGHPILIYYPDYAKHGRKAPFVRNYSIVENSDVVVSLWNGESAGTKHSMEIAEEQNKKLIVYNQIHDEVTTNYTGGLLND